jgi:hypothetical protein
MYSTHHHHRSKQHAHQSAPSLYKRALLLLLLLLLCPAVATACTDASTDEAVSPTTSVMMRVIAVRANAISSGEPIEMRHLLRRRRSRRRRTRGS